MSHPVTWFQIQGPSGDPLKSFYQSVFGWKLNPMPDGMAMVAPDAPHGIAGGVGASRDGAAGVSVFIEVDELSDALGKVSAAGGTPAMDPMDLGEMGRIAGFLDPANNWIGIWAPPTGMSRAQYYAKMNPAPAPAPKKKAAKAKPAKAKPAKKKAAKAKPAKKKGAKKRRR